MKNNVLKSMLLLTVFAAACLNTEAQNFSWAKKGGLWAYDYGNGISHDNAGNIYVAGKYEMNAKFGGVTLPCQGNHDMYLAKYDPAGNMTWIRTAGGYTGDYATSVACDGSNYVYVAGEIEGTNALIKFSNSPITLTCQSSNDIMLAKYDLSGNLLWARRAGSPYYEKALGVTYDAAGNVYICGLFNKYAKFGGTTTIYGYGGNDIFLAKYDANGNFLWVRNAGSPGRDEAKSVKVDAAGNVYICGLYKNNCKFGSATLSAGGEYYNAFLAKYSSSGTLQWVRTGGGNYDDAAWGLALDESGKIYIAGEFNGDAYFSGTKIWTTGRADVLVACYNPDGGLQWIRKAGGELSDRARGLTCKGDKLYITGQFGKTAYFGAKTLNGADSSDIFVASLNTSGTFLWAMAAGGQPDAYEPLGYESGIAVTVDASDNVYATGAMLNGGTFGGTTLTAYARTDVFITKIVQASAMMPEFAEAQEQNKDPLNEEAAAASRLASGSPVQEQKEYSLKLFPNPNKDHLVFVKMEGLKNTDAMIQLELFDLSGRTVISEKLSYTEGSTVGIPLENLPTGIYLLKVSHNDQQAFERLMVQGGSE
jgi:hypothetical protein